MNWHTRSCLCSSHQPQAAALTKVCNSRYSRHIILTVSVLERVVVPDALVKELATLRFGFAKLLRNYFNAAKTRRDLWLAGFLKDLNKSVEFVVVGVHCSLKVADERLRFLVRVSLIIAFRSLTVSYEISAQSGREESSSVNAVH